MTELKVGLLANFQVRWRCDESAQSAISCTPVRLAATAAQYFMTWLTTGSGRRKKDLREQVRVMNQMVPGRIRLGGVMHTYRRTTGFAREREDPARRSRARPNGDREIRTGNDLHPGDNLGPAPPPPTQPKLALPLLPASGQR